MVELIHEFIQSTGFSHLTFSELAMIGIACVLLYLGIVRKYEPLLLVPISFGMLLVNSPSGRAVQPEGQGVIGGCFIIYQGLEKGIYPPLILGIGALTDFGPLIANPVTLLLGAAAQLGIFTTLAAPICLVLLLRNQERSVLSAGLMVPPLYLLPASWRLSCWALSLSPLIPTWP